MPTNSQLLRCFGAPKKRMKIKIAKNQVTRGHNIVADGWAGAYNPHPHPRPPHTHSDTQTITTAGSKRRIYALFNSITTDGPTDRRTDKASYRVACPQLKSAKTRIFDAAVAIVTMCVRVCVGWARVWMGVSCPCPPVRNDIVTPRPRLPAVMRTLSKS